MTQPTPAASRLSVYSVRLRPDQVQWLREVAQEGAYRPTTLLRELIDRAREDSAQ